MRGDAFGTPVVGLGRLLAFGALAWCTACTSGVVSSPGFDGRGFDGNKADEAFDMTAIDGGPFDVDGRAPAGACAPTPAPSALDVNVAVDSGAAYGTHTFDVPSKTNWVNAGVFLEPGESATIEVTGGQWSSNGSAPHGPGGRTPATLERGCPIGALAARVGLTYEGALTCLASGVGTITASAAGPVFLGMVVGTDLSETYHSRVPTSGALTVRVTSTANSIPVVTVDELDCADLSTIRSGHVELAGRHVSVLAPVAAYNRDAWSAALSITTLDEIYEIEAELRGTTPHEGQRIRFVADPAIQNVGYMLAGNPIRMVPDLMTGNDTQRILRASLPATDIWGFAHELGHTFTMVGGTWTYMVLNLESWPNVFTLYALERLGRNQGQPNVATYCDGKSAYLASGAYATFKSDPFVQLCFLMEFTKAYGYDVWKRFYAAMNTTTNGDIGYNGSDASVWRFARDRLSAAAGTDVTPTFNAWRVPLQ